MLLCLYNTSLLLVYSQGFYYNVPQDRQPFYMNGMYVPGNVPQPQQPVMYYNNYMNTLPRRITQEWSKPPKQINLHNGLTQKPKSKHFLPRKFNLFKGKPLTAFLYVNCKQINVTRTLFITISQFTAELKNSPSLFIYQHFLYVARAQHRRNIN